MPRRLQAIIFAAFGPIFFCSTAQSSRVLTVFEEAALLDDKDALKEAIRGLQANEADGARSSERFHILEIYLASIKDDKYIDAAIKIVEASTGARPNSTGTWMLLADIYNSRLNAASIFGKLGAARDLRDALKRVLALDPSHQQALQYLAIYYANAPHVAGGDKGRAAELMARLEQVSKARWYHAKALIAKRAGDNALALQFYRDAIREKPNYDQVYVNAAMELDASGRPMDALLVLRDGSEIVANPGESLYQLARLASITKSNCNVGMSSIQRYFDIPAAVRRIPTAWIIYRRGLLHHCLGDDNGAMLDYQAALQLDPNLDDARNAIAAIGPDVSTR